MSALKEVKHIASACNHFGMCKIDFLNTGVCPSGLKSKYVAYFPQGRMEIANALAEGLIPVTEKLVEIAEACNLCGICNRQCNFITNLRPLPVMEALKTHVAEYQRTQKPVSTQSEDMILRELRQIVGEPWASNDPAILVAYSRDTALFSERNIPCYVVMTETAQEVAAVVMLAKKHNLPCLPRSSGGSGQGLSLGKGIIMDLYRMKKISVDPQDWSALIEPGVTAWELQKEAEKHGLRASVAEPSAGICSNILSTRLISPFSHAYGTGGDIVIDAEFVDCNGKIRCLNDRDGAHLFVHDRQRKPIKTVVTADIPPKVNFEAAPPENIFTKMKVKLFPIMEQEEAFLIPFSDFKKAVTLSSDLAKRRHGIGMAVISTHYCAFIIGNTSRAKKELEHVLRKKLEIEFFLMIIGDKHTRGVIEEYTDSYIDPEIFKIIMMSIPRFYGNEGIELLSELPSDKKPYEVVFKKEMIPLLKITLAPSIQNTIAYVDTDLKDFYKKVFSRPETSNLIWLMMYRITTARLGRDYNYFEIIGWISSGDIPKMEKVFGDLKSIGQRHGVVCDFGYCTTQEMGKWIFFEFDYFYRDDPAEKQKAKKAVLEALKTFNRHVSKEGLNGLLLPEKCVSQGICRTQSLLYNDIRSTKIACERIVDQVFEVGSSNADKKEKVYESVD